jgi:hypothetical protein
MQRRITMVGLSFSAVLVITLSVAYTARADNFNTAFGTGALSSNTTGTHNSAFGFSALFSNTTGFANTASGFESLFFNTGFR